MTKRIARLASAMAAVVAAAIGTGAARAGEDAVRVVYGLAPGQVWRSTQTIERETRLGDAALSDRGEAVVRYRVRPAPEGRLALDAEFVSLRTSEGARPFDAGAIRFRAVLTPRGRVVASTAEVGDAEPPGAAPDGSGEPGATERDPVAWRQVLRSLGEAWTEAVFWLPELPEQALRPGDAFTLEDERELGAHEPGVAARQARERTYTLREVRDGRAYFDLASHSRVETSTAQSALASERTGEGEAVFDLERGMWVRHVTRARDRTTFEGADGLREPRGTATTTTTTTVTMEREE